MIKLLLAISLSFAVAACATTPVPLSSAKPVPDDRLLAFQNSAIVTLIRDKGHVGSACYYGVYANGILAARIDVAEFVQLYLDPGEVLLRVGYDPYGKALCSFGKDMWIQRETLLKPGQKKGFRITTDASGNFEISRTDINNRNTN